MSFQIACPFCGERPQPEFAYRGTAGEQAPPSLLDPLSEELYFSDNVAGEHLERWVHRFGCERWMLLRRDTRTNAISSVHAGVDPREAAG